MMMKITNCGIVTLRTSLLKNPTITKLVMKLIDTIPTGKKLKFQLVV